MFTQVQRWYTSYSLQLVDVHGTIAFLWMRGCVNHRQNIVLAWRRASMANEIEIDEVNNMYKEKELWGPFRGLTITVKVMSTFKAIRFY